MNDVDLMKVIMAYNNYIQLANEENWYKTGWRPASIEEFYDNGYEFYDFDSTRLAS